MLDDYKDKQTLAYNIMKNEILSNHISHAYLFDENNNIDSFNIVIAFAKEIICKNLDENVKKIVCKRIDDGNYPEIKIICPDGMLIKKKQILDLQLDFSKSAFEGNRRIYIIQDADKMRSETANSMLKFLEEPVNGIVAILMTNNFNNLLSTIVSRCQVIRLNNDNLNVYNSEFDDLILNFINSIEFDGIKSIISIQDILFKNISIKDRDKLIIIFDKMIDMYYDIMKIICGNKDISYINYIDTLTVIANNNSNKSILKKINFIVDAKENVKYNVNINLLIDSLIVNIGGKNEHSWS